MDYGGEKMRLIDADALKLADFQDFSNTDVFAAIDAQPTVDAVPVVRCRYRVRPSPLHREAHVGGGRP